MAFVGIQTQIKRNNRKSVLLLIAFPLYIVKSPTTVCLPSASISISKINNSQFTIHNSQLNNSPDIAQTIAVTCFGLGIGCHLTGLHTLKIKETDRLEALKNELTKLGANVSVTNDSLTLEPSEKINENISIKTYQDHRMAMALSLLSLCSAGIEVADPEVVTKSWPTFFADMTPILGAHEMGN